MDIEKMKAELEAAGYSEEILSTGETDMHISIWYTPDGLGICGDKQIYVSEASTQATEFAYTHLQKERQFEAMKALLTRVAHETEDNDFHTDLPMGLWQEIRKFVEGQKP